MNFASIPTATAVFVDANPFVYHFTAHPTYGAACTSLLDRIDNRDIEGVTSAHVLGELVHRLMTAEAQQRFGWPTSGIPNRLRRNPVDVQQLSWHKRGIDELAVIGVRVLKVEGGDVSLAADAITRFGLLNNDALIVVLMQRHGLTHLASLDSDLDRVPGLRDIHRYSLAASSSTAVRDNMASVMSSPRRNNRCLIANHKLARLRAPLRGCG